VKDKKFKAKDVKFGGMPKLGSGNRESVAALNSVVPGGLVLHRSAPNPFSRGTVIRFDLSTQGEVNLSIHDIEGRLVKKLVGEVRPAGSHSVAWDGRDSSGAEVSVGIYFVHFKSGGTVATDKVVVAH
jgi:hypothetical protein